MDSISVEVAHIIVTDLYKNILGRTPDSDGLKVHSDFLVEKFNSGGYGLLLSDFLSSSERAAITNESIICKEILSVSQTLSIIREKYNFVSLGTHCYTAYFLKRLGLKQASYPFDWLFSNNKAVTHAIKDDFGLLLDRSMYSDASPEAQGRHAANHNYYFENYGILNMFNHRDPRLNEDYEYLLRTVERFRSLKLKNNIFVSSFRWSLSNFSSFIELSKTINENYPDSLILGISIEQRDLRESTIVPLSEKSSIVKLRSTSPWMDVRFGSPFDDIRLVEETIIAINDMLK